MKVNNWQEFERFRDENPLQVREIDLSECPITELPLNAFANCSNLEKVILPEGLKEISTGAFYGCYSLKSLELPESVEVMYGEFEECGVEELTLPEGLRSLYVSGLKFLDMSRCRTIKALNAGNCKINGIKVVYLPPCLEKIGNADCLRSIDYCFASPTLKSIGGMFRTGLFCSSPKIELSRDIVESLLHVPEENIEATNTAASKAGLTDNHFKICEMPYIYKYMYEK